jgi:DtxR family Mn-dependent transcriptional regulator
MDACSDAAVAPRNGATTTTRRGVSEAVEDYAKTIYALQSRQNTDAVKTNAIAHRLGVTAASASSMVKKLADLGLVAHVRYRGVRLTAEGQRIALEVLRHHRLLETYLNQALGMPWDRVHDEAEILEHHISEELEKRIATTLNDPTRDPHGDPIPNEDLTLQDESTVALSELEPGQSALFTRVSDSDATLLSYLAEQHLLPGTELVVEDKQPFDGPLFVRAGEHHHVLGATLARAMRMRLLPNDSRKA